MLMVNLTSVCQGSSSRSAKKYQSFKLTNGKFILVFQKLVMQSSKQHIKKQEVRPTPWQQVRISQVHLGSCE